MRIPQQTYCYNVSLYYNFNMEQFITLEFYKQPHKKKHSIYEKGDFHAIFV